MKKKLIAATAALSMSLAFGGILANAHTEKHESSIESSSESKQEVQSGLAKIREATTKYHDIEKAKKDGFEPHGGFVYVPGLGGMGIHYVKTSLIDGIINPAEPDILLYEPLKNGEYRLVGVEYTVPYAIAGTDVPTLFGQPFNGPMINHEPHLEAIPLNARPDPEDEPTLYHYDLHVWVWQANPNGVFAQFNPNIKGK